MRYQRKQIKRLSEVRGRICRYCGDPDSLRYWTGRADVCSACSKLRERNGTHSCGAIYVTLFNHGMARQCTKCPGEDKELVVLYHGSTEVEHYLATHWVNWILSRYSVERPLVLEVRERRNAMLGVVRFSDRFQAEKRKKWAR